MPDCELTIVSLSVVGRSALCLLELVLVLIVPVRSLLYA
jgi:hypothetical protein